LHLQILLTVHLLPVFGVIPAMQINDHHLDRYINQRRKRGVKYSTIHRELVILQAILNWSASRRPALIHFNPVRHYNLPAPDDAIIAPPTQDELKRILEKAAPHLKRAILLAYFLGLRPGSVELLSLEWGMVNWETEAILITSAHKGGPEKRLVPIHKQLMPLMRIWADEDGSDGPIVHIRHRPLRSIKKAWKGALARAGITRRIRPHDPRHPYITTALERGGDLKSLAKIVGSKPETIMRHYQHVSTHLERKTTQKIPPLAI